MQRSGEDAPLPPAGPRSPCDHPRDAAAGIAGTVHQTAHRARPGRRQAVGRQVRQSGTRRATPCLPGSCRSRRRRRERISEDDAASLKRSLLRLDAASPSGMGGIFRGVDPNASCPSSMAQQNKPPCYRSPALGSLATTNISSAPRCPQVMDLFTLVRAVAGLPK